MNQALERGPVGLHYLHLEQAVGVLSIELRMGGLQVGPSVASAWCSSSLSSNDLLVSPTYLVVLLAAVGPQIMKLGINMN